MSLRIFKKRRKWYQNNRWHFALDISLSILILLMLTVLINLILFQPRIDSSNLFLKDKGAMTEPVVIEDPLIIEASLNKNLLNENEAVIIYLKLKNNGSEEIKNLKIKALSQSNDFSLTNNSYNLEKLAAAESLELEIRPEILIDNPLVRQIAWHLEFNFNYLEKEFRQDKELLNLFYNSQTKVSATAYYHNLRGDQLGLGPIPPIVGIPTSYFVFFEIANLGNNLNNFVLSANLAKGVELTNNLSLLAGAYNYDEDNHRIIWQVNTISQKGGNYQAAFELKVIPQMKDLDKNLDLITSLVYSYQDNLTKKQISGSLAAIDNSLPFDLINKNQGKVRK